MKSQGITIQGVACHQLIGTKLDAETSAGNLKDIGKPTGGLNIEIRRIITFQQPTALKRSCIDRHRYQLRLNLNGYYGVIGGIGSIFLT